MTELETKRSNLKYLDQRRKGLGVSCEDRVHQARIRSFPVCQSRRKLGKSAHLFDRTLDLGRESTAEWEAHQNAPPTTQPLADEDAIALEPENAGERKAILRHRRLDHVGEFGSV